MSITRGAPKRFGERKACMTRLNPALVERLQNRIAAANEKRRETDQGELSFSEGMAQLLALPGPSAATYQLVESTLPGQMQRDETTLFDGIDTSIPAGVNRSDLAAGIHHDRAWDRYVGVSRRH